MIAARNLRGRAGAQVATTAGASLEFLDYRDYQPGDDLRLVDWSVYARTDRETVRRHQDEVSPCVEIKCDTSASLTVPNGIPAQAVQAVGELIAAAAERAGCRVRWNPSSYQPRSIRFFLSDLLFSDPPEHILSPLTREAAAFHVIRVLSREERAPRIGGAWLFCDAETGEERLLSLDAATCAAHQAALTRHTANWTTAIRRWGGTFTDVEAELTDVSQAVAALVASRIVEVIS